MPNDVVLTVRGRGTRNYPANRQFLVSRAGDAPPALTRAGEIQPDDYVGVTYGGTWAETPVALPQQEFRKPRGSEKPITLPETLTDDLALFLGAYFSEGHCNRSNWTIVITNAVESVLQQVRAACLATFGLRGRIVHQAEKCPAFIVSSKRLVNLLDELGCGSRASNKRVPAIIGDSTRDHVIRFLQGAALDAYTCAESLPRWAICLDSHRAIDDLQDLVTRLGIPNAQIAKWNSKYEKHYYELYAPGPAGQELSRLVPFLEPHKHERALTLQARSYTHGDWSDVIPGIRGKDLHDLIPRGNSGASGKGSGRQRFRHLCDPRTRHVTRTSVLRAAEAAAVLPRWLEEVATSTMRFYPVIHVSAGGVALGC